jgi:signal transduction histidine kinase
LVYNSISTIKTIISGSYNDHNITLIENIPQKDKIVCCGIQSQLSQVILNILNNAKDALIEQNIEKPIVLIKLFAQNDNIHIEIYDNAKGIPDDIIHKIFEPYFTTKFNSDGTGIGLYMSYEIIQKHFKGTLSASNRNFTIDEQEYFGACFCITIPSNLQDCHKDDAKIIYE